MGIDSLKSGLSSLVKSVEQKIETKLEELKPAAPPPPPSAPRPTEEFTDAKKKPVSITGKFAQFSPAGTGRLDLAGDVASRRRVTVRR
jgi:hypothetical protein